jgi:hypothetical protein
LDGIYVIRTSESVERLSAADTVRSYKSLAQVERAFRTLKGMDLLIRPIRHRTEDRVPAHIFLCLLAYYVEWHLRRAWAPLLFDDEQLAQERRRRDPISAGNRLAIGSRREAQPADGGRVSRKQFRHSDGRASQSSTRDLWVEIGRIHPKLSAGARANSAASQGLCAARLVASSWKLNLELSLGESAEYRPNPLGTSA